MANLPPARFKVGDKVKVVPVSGSVNARSTAGTVLTIRRVCDLNHIHGAGRRYEFSGYLCGIGENDLQLASAPYAMGDMLRGKPGNGYSITTSDTDCEIVRISGTNPNAGDVVVRKQTAHDGQHVGRHYPVDFTKFDRISSPNQLMSDNQSTTPERETTMSLDYAQSLVNELKALELTEDQALLVKYEIVQQDGKTPTLKGNEMAQRQLFLDKTADILADIKKIEAARIKKASTTKA